MREFWVASGHHLTRRAGLLHEAAHGIQPVDHRFAALQRLEIQLDLVQAEHAGARELPVAQQELHHVGAPHP